MTKEPEIVKELREAETLGLLTNDSSTIFQFETRNEETKTDSNEIPLSIIEEQFRTIFENYMVGITLVDEQERIVSWNKYAEELFNMNEEDLYLQHVKVLYPPESWKKIRKENIRQKGIKFKIETKMNRKGKPAFDAEISLSILKGEGGKVTGSVGIITDISRLKNVERKLLESQHKYKTIFENSAVAIMLTNEKEELISWNKYAELLLGMNEGDLHMKPIKSFYPPEEWKKIRGEKIREKGMQHHLETKMLRKNQEPLNVDISLSVLKDPKGNIIGSIGVIKDISEQKETEAKVKKSERRYKNLFETAIDPILVLDCEGYFIDVNKQVTELLGYNKKELIGNQFQKLNILHKESIDLTVENFKKRMNGVEIPPYEIKIVTKKGEIIPAEINASPLYDNNKLLGELVILRDLRERLSRKSFQKQLLKSEKKFQEIFDATSDIILYLTPDGKISDINSTALYLIGIEKENIINKTISDLKNVFLKEDLQRHLNAIKNAQEGNRVKEYESELLYKNEIKYKFLFSIDIIKESEEVKAILVRGRDITQRHLAWEELVKLEEKYRILAETSADGVITIDPLGRLTYINPSFEKICGRRKSQILATLLRDYFSDESVYLFQQMFMESRKNDKKIENIELELVKSDEDSIPIEINIAPLKKEGNFTGMICTVRDITERKKIEEELKKSERLKTEFMNIAAHELKSPVTPIKGYLDLIIADKDVDEKVKNWAKISLRNSERLLKLVNDILDVSRLDTDTMRFDMEKINPIDLLDEIVEDMKPAVEAKNLEFIAHIPKDLPPIMGDRYRLSQVLKNLTVNALKFTDNGSISIVAKKEHKHIIISVMDSGIGISNSEIKKIFSKFYQAYTGDDRKNEGTGLGLFICRQIIQKHNGEIWAGSSLRKGSTFTVKIPVL